MSSSDQSEPTPAELRALMTEADGLAARILDLHERLWASEGTSHTAFRLEDAAGEVRRAGQALSQTADDLARTRTARDPKLCGIPWGVCPDHGNTLTSSGGRSWCREPGCGRTWNYDRGGTPCSEPVTHRVTDATGSSMLTCRGHALGAEKQLEGGTVTPLAQEENGRG